MENAATTSNPETKTYEDELAAVAAAVAEFPAEFGLRGYPGKTFRVSPTASYYSAGWDHGGGDRQPAGVQVYTQVQADENSRYGNAGDWLDFAKGTVEELRREVIDSPRYANRRNEIEAEAEKIDKKFEEIDEAQHDLDERRRKLGERYDTLIANATDELDRDDYYDIFGTYPDESGKK